MLPQWLQTTFAMEYFASKFWGGFFVVVMIGWLVGWLV